MFVLFIAVLVALILIGRKITPNQSSHNDDYWDDDICTGDIFCIMGVIGLVICLICSACLWSTISTEYVVDNKIAMYEDENGAIEKRIDAIVSDYSLYEHDTFMKFKSGENDAVALISLFPELKTNSLIQEQMEIYVSNHEKIKELKEKKIDIQTYRWLLYFGKEA